MPSERTPCTIEASPRDRDAPARPPASATDTLLAASLSTEVEAEIRVISVASKAHPQDALSLREPPEMSQKVRKRGNRTRSNRRNSIPQRDPTPSAIVKRVPEIMLSELRNNRPVIAAATIHEAHKTMATIGGLQFLMAQRDAFVNLAKHLSVSAVPCAPCATLSKFFSFPT